MLLHLWLQHPHHHLDHLPHLPHLLAHTTEQTAMEMGLTVDVHISVIPATRMSQRFLTNITTVAAIRRVQELVDINKHTVKGFVVTRQAVAAAVVAAVAVVAKTPCQCQFRLKIALSVALVASMTLNLVRFAVNKSKMKLVI